MASLAWAEIGETRDFQPLWNPPSNSSHFALLLQK